MNREDIINLYSAEVVVGQDPTLDSFANLVAEIRFLAELCRLENHEQIHSLGSAVGAVRRLASELLESRRK